MKFIKQFDGAAGQINFKPSSMLNKEDLDAKELQTKKTDNYKSKNESWKQAWEAATHKMPDGTIMKGAKHKDETKDEANDVDNGDEKKDTKKKLHADSGSKLTKVETEPSVDYKN